MKASHLLALSAANRIAFDAARRWFGPQPDYDREPCDRCLWAQFQSKRGCESESCSCCCHLTREDDGA